MTELRFAVAGVPRSTPPPGGTVEGMYHAQSLGINAMEIEWVQRVPNTPKRMEEIRRAAEELQMTLTCHAPYYVNLNSPDSEKLAASIGRVNLALSMAQIAGIRSVCVHPAFYLGMPPEKAYDHVRHSMETILKTRSAAWPNVNLGLETMGKISQFGTLEEVLRLSKEFDLYPVIDPAHMHARTNGKINTTEEWHNMLDLYQQYLGDASLRNMHIHYSGIAYGPKGEKHHLPLCESDARWKDFLSVLKERKIGGTVVCESPLMEDDTLLLKQTYEKL